MSIVVASLPVLGTVLLNHRAFGGKASKPSAASSSFGISKPKASHASSSQSREGIIRQDEVELEYRNREPSDLEKSGNNGQYAYRIEQQATPWASTQRL